MSFPRSLLVLFILLLAVVIVSCSREEQPPAPSTAAEPAPFAAEKQPAAEVADAADVKNPCPGNKKGVDNRAAPIICVDDSGTVFAVSPDPFYAWDAMGPKDPRPVRVHWFTASGKGDLRLEFHPSKTDGRPCVKDLECPGNGHCMAVTMATDGKQIDCKYDVWVEGNTIPRLDPDGVIVPCCSAPVAESVTPP